MIVGDLIEKLVELDLESIVVLSTDTGILGELDTVTVEKDGSVNLKPAKKE